MERAGATSTGSHSGGRGSSAPSLMGSPGGRYLGPFFGVSPSFLHTLKGNF